jgi:hypothetical protein
MISFVAVLLLSFITLWLGTYIADRVEQRCAPCGEILTASRPLDE